jgi:putative NADH-flavin reductase
MRLIVFGASGACGRHVVRIAVAHGHSVTAVVRPETPFESPGASVVRGDVLSAKLVASVMAGHDAVVSCLGMRYAHPWAKRRSPDDFTSRATSNILAGMKAAGVRRISVVSAAGVGSSRPTLNWPMRVLLATSNVGVAYHDLERVEALLQGSDLDWQAVRPTTLTNGRARGRVRSVERYTATAHVSREDVSMFLVEAVEAGSFAARTPMIST